MPYRRKHGLLAGVATGGCGAGNPPGIGALAENTPTQNVSYSRRPKSVV